MNIYLYLFHESENECNKKRLFVRICEFDSFSFFSKVACEWLVGTNDGTHVGNSGWHYTMAYCEYPSQCLHSWAYF